MVVHASDVARSGYVERDQKVPRAFVVQDADPANVAVIRLDWDGEQKTWLVTAHPDDKGRWAGDGKTSRTAESSGLVQGNPSQPTQPQDDSVTNDQKQQSTTPITDFGEKIGGARKDTASNSGTKTKTGKTDERPAWARRYEIGQIASDMKEPQNVGKWAIHDNKNLDWKKQARQVGRLHDTREEAEAAIPMIAVALKHRAMPLRDGKYEIWREVTDRKRVKVVDQTFDTREDAMRYMAKHAVEIIETNTTFGEANLPRPESTTRIGEARRTGNVRDSDFVSVFGFRGVEFGNWNNQAERQDLLNDAYDALLDLAEVMGIPPKGISLNGELALAFGARGQGLSGARAHYERNKAVINLTKMNGAGSLAHEWFHAIDHYFGRQDGKSSSEWVVGRDGTRSLKASLSADDDYASAGMRGERSGMRAELQKAYRDVMVTMTKKAEKYIDDTVKADEFVGRTRDDVREKLDSIRKHLADQLDARYYKRMNKPASAEQLAEFDAIAERIVAGEALEVRLSTTDKKPRTPMAGIRWTNDALERISAIMKEVRGRQGFSSDQSGPLDELRRRMTMYSSRLKMLADAQASTEKTRAVPTEFAMNARELDQGRGQDYWTTPHEMAARAFQGYVEDKVAEKGGQSPFLNYAPESAAIPTPWGWKRPYPHGEERKAINAAFDRLVDTIEVEETDGGVKLYSVSPETRAAYENRIDELFAGKKPSNEGVRVLDRSDVLDLLGYGDRPVVLAESHAIDDGRYNHPLTAEQWKKIPEWLENPVAVFKRDDGHLTVVTDELVDGNPLIIGLEPGAKPSGGRNINKERHLLLTAYVKDRGPLPVGRMIRDGNLLFVDARKSPGFNTGSGLRLPSSGVDFRGLGYKVHNGADLFKYRQTKGEGKSSIGEGSGPALTSAREILAADPVLSKAMPFIEVKNSRDGVPAGAKPIGAEGYYHNGKVTLFADNIKATPTQTAEERLKWVTFHEVTHRGVANLAESKEYMAELQRAGKNPFIKNLAKKIYEKRQKLPPKYHVTMEVAIEEALAETWAALQTGSSKTIKAQYGLHFPLSIRPRAKSAIARFFEVVKRIYSKAVGRGLTNGQVAELLLKTHEAGMLPDGTNPSGRRDSLSETVSDKPTGSEITEAQRQLEEQLAIADRMIAERGGLFAPNGEKSKLNRMQWAQVRTANFKRWFGDWIGEKAIVTPIELELSGWSGGASELSAMAREAYTENLQGSTIDNPSMGVTVAFSSEGKGEAFGARGKMRNPIRAELVKVLRELVRSAVHISEDAPKKGRERDTKSFHTLVAPLRVNGEVFSVKVTVREALLVPEGGVSHKFYDVTTIQIERSPGVHGFDAAGAVSRPAPSEASDVIVSDLVKAFNLDMQIDPDSVSKVVDANGEPLVVYHGTDAEFTDPVFRIPDSPEPGAFFTPDTRVASDYADRYAEYSEQPNIIPVFLSMPDARVVNGGGKSFSTVNKSAFADGNPDGLIIRNVIDGYHGAGDVYVAARPNQIKSATGNAGTFSPKTDDIRYSAPPTDDTSLTRSDFVNIAKEWMFSAWAKSLGTQLNTAMLEPLFKPTYDLVQRYLQHTSNDACL